MKRLCFLFFISTAVTSYSQQVKEYYTAYAVKTDSSESFYYSIGNQKTIYHDQFKVQRFVDSVYSYYTSSGRLMSREFYNTNGMREGPYIEYYENGSKKAEGFYKANRKSGVVMQWYDNGGKHFEIQYEDMEESGPVQHDFKVLNYWDFAGKQLIRDGNGHCLCNFSYEDITEIGKVVNGLKDSTWHALKNDSLYYTENYSKGVFNNGVSLSKGQRYAYTSIMLPPEFKGGYQGMIGFIRSNMKYPREARKRGYQGTVYVSFVVGKDGSVQDVRILQGVAPVIDEEALRVVALMSGQWLPGKERGKPVYVRYNLPLKFKLN